MDTTEGLRAEVSKKDAELHACGVLMQEADDQRTTEKTAFLEEQDDLKPAVESYRKLLADEQLKNKILEEEKQRLFNDIVDHSSSLDGTLDQNRRYFAAMRSLRSLVKAYRAVAKHCMSAMLVRNFQHRKELMHIKNGVAAVTSRVLPPSLSTLYRILLIHRSKPSCLDRTHNNSIV